MYTYRRPKRSVRLGTLALVCLLMAMAALTGCSRTAAVPMPHVKTVDGTLWVQVYPGNWEWRGMTSNFRMAPHEVLKNTDATIVPAGSVLTISYAEPPKKGSLHARLWIDGAPTEQPLGEDGQFTIPSQPGVYIYEFDAAWRQGAASYSIKVEVRETTALVATPSEAAARIQPTMAGWSIGPLYSAAGQGGYPQWVGESSLAVKYRDEPIKVVDLAQSSVLQLNGTVAKGIFSMATDGSKLAYVDGLDLVLWERATGEERHWPLAERRPGTGVTPADYRVYPSTFFWSPDGRNLLGRIWPTPDVRALYSEFWVLDLATEQIAPIGTAPWSDYSRPVWSPDNQQVVLWENLDYHSTFPNYRAILIDLPTQSVRVIVPPTIRLQERQIKWQDGRLSIIPAIDVDHPIRIEPFDTAKNGYLNRRASPLEYKLTELHWLTADQQVLQRLDLLPALRDAGVDLDGIMGLHITPASSPDGRYLYLDGNVLIPQQWSRAYALHGIVDTRSMSVHFLPFTMEQKCGYFIPNSYLQRWYNGKAILTSTVGQGLRLLDPETMEVTAYPTPGDIKCVYCVDRGMLFTTDKEVDWLSQDGQVHTVRTALQPDAFQESFVLPVLSPSLRYISIIQRTGVDQIILDVVDLDQLP